MKKRNFKTLIIRKEQVVSLNNSLKGGVVTTAQSTVRPTNEGDFCMMSKAVCPTNWFDCK